MEKILIKRLETIGGKVREGMEACKGFVENCQEGSAKLDKHQYLSVEKLRTSVDRLRGEISNCLTTYTEISFAMEAKIEELTNLQIESEEMIVEIDSQNSFRQQDAHTIQSIPTEQTTNTRLPKLEMTKYDGDILRWHEFWDQFLSVIENRKQMSDVDKLAYLNSLVEGDAKRSIEGLDITNSNYRVAVNRLTERFGKKGSLIDAHYTALQQLPKSTNDISSCRRTLDEIERHLRILQSLGENTEHKQLRATILEKFPDEIMFDLRMAMSSDDHSVSEVRHLLEKVICARESANRMASIYKSEQPSTTNINPACTIETLYASINDLKRKFTSTSKATTSGNHFPRVGENRFPQRTFKNQRPGNEKQSKRRGSHEAEKSTPKKRQNLQCIFCSDSHTHENCDKFKTVEERKKKLRNRCYLCLRDSHFLSKCPYKSTRCPHCNRRGSHNRCLCPKLDKTMHTNTFLSQIKCDTILQTATIKIGSPKGKPIKKRFLFDTGSQKTYIRSDIAKQLKLEIIEPTCLTIFTFGSVKPKTIDTNIVSFQIQANDGKLMNIMAYTIPTLTGIIPSYDTLKTNLKSQYPYLDIAEDVTDDCAADVIIGNDHYHDIIKEERINITPTFLLIDSVIGWIPSGTYTDSEFQYNVLSVLTYFHQSSPKLKRTLHSHPDPAIRDDNIKNIWDLENIGIKDSPKVLQDEEVVQFFNDTTLFHDNRYQVKWPWAQYPPELPVNLGLALGRLKSLIKRSNRDILKKYDDVIQDQLKKDIVEVVTENKLPDTHPVHYLPHHCVLQPHKTTKLRIVYDGSAKLKGQLSLNEFLYKGPLLLEDLTLLLLKFRQNPVGIVADIEKAFLQIGLQSQDRDVTRFLWVKDILKEPSGDNLLHLRFCRVPFGIISSPFLLAATIKKHLLKNNNPMTNKVAQCLYVDNLVTGVNTEEEAKSLFHETRTSFEELSMNIREWNSNSQSFLNSIPPEAKAVESSVSVLGLLWDTTTDMLSIAVQRSTIEQKVSSKRDVLRIIASVFDPFGLTAPLTLPTKLLLQDLWKEKLKWDTPLSRTHQERWERCRTFLKGIPDISFPRYHFTNNILSPKDWSYELHCFVDASKDAYVAVIYLRASKGGQHLTSLMMSRSRLTPIKRKECFTIPKLELLAVVIGIRLLDYVRREMVLPAERNFLWTDSQVVLGWLKSERLLPPFVARRIAEVRSMDDVQFRYIRSSLNPADVATRTITGTTLPKLWIDGPNFLMLPSTNWPANECFPPDPMSQGSLTCMESLSAPDCDHTPPLIHVNTTNTASYALPATGVLLPTPQIIDIQTNYFPDEHQGKMTPLAKSLGLYKDERGILRCRGRFANAEFAVDQKYPILLPKLAAVTSDIIKRIHSDHHHVGILHTLSLLRQTYWVPQGRSLVTKILNHCSPCNKYGGGPYKLPQMPALPLERVTFSHPFANTGVDYFGPLTTTESDVKQKRWACVFTCMAVRAIHIEMVNDCSADEFLLAFRRFCATRGTPCLVVSDNAANFKLASSMMDQLTPTHWKFIPTLSPWFGGFYERLVGLIKNCLRRTLDRSLLTDRQLQTVLHEIAATLNTRPLTAVTSNLESILTPSHFLLTYGPPVPHLSPPVAALNGTRIREQILCSWKRTEALLKQFKAMFHSHYLTSLRERHQLGHKQPRILSHRDPAVGDVVQVQGDTNNRVLWRVGAITSLITSADGAVRTARVSFSDGTTLTRSVGHLYPLEMDVDPPRDRDLPYPSTGQSNTAATSGPPDTIQAHPLPPSNPLCSASSEVVARPEPLQTVTPSSRTQRDAAKRAIRNIRLWTSAMFAAAVVTTP